MDEHIVRDSSGRFIGVHTLDFKKEENTESWEAVDLAVREYIQIHPMEIRALCIQNEEVRRQNYNRFGSSEGKSIRHGISIPPGLYFKVIRIMPDLFDNPRKLHEFMRKYGGFKTCETI